MSCKVAHVYLDLALLMTALCNRTAAAYISSCTKRNQVTAPEPSAHRTLLKQRLYQSDSRQGENGDSSWAHVPLASVRTQSPVLLGPRQ